MASRRFQEIAGFNDDKLILFGLPLASLLSALLLFSEPLVQGQWKLMSVCFPISLVYTAVFWFSLRAIYTFLKQRFPASSDIGKRAAGAFFAIVVMYFIVDGGLDILFKVLLPDSDTEPNPILEFLITLVLSALVIAIYEAISFYLQLQKAVSEKAELERRHVSSQLEGLRNQVNPHFLFNSLNTLIYLIPENSDKAVRFVQQLSKVYRFILESRDSGLIPLSEEIEFLNAYIFLQKERFGDNLQVSVQDFSVEKPVWIVPLSLQMLFENAVKHNVISAEKPLFIEVFMEKDRLIVRNNLQRKNQVMDSTGVGLQNIKDRYKLLTNKEVNVIFSQTHFTVALPAVVAKPKETAENIVNA